MNGWWFGLATLAACGTSKPVDSTWSIVGSGIVDPTTGLPPGTSGGTPTGWTGTPTGWTGTTAGRELPCGPALWCYSYEYCSVTVPGEPPTGTGTTDPNTYSCVLAPLDCNGVSTCACIGCGDLTGTGTSGPYLCEEIPSIGATCTFIAP